MVLIKRNSFLGIPAEIRLRIYQHVLEDVSMSVIAQASYEASSEVPDDVEASDDLEEPDHVSYIYGRTSTLETLNLEYAITLTSKLIRDESLPLLFEALSTLSIQFCIDYPASPAPQVTIKPAFRNRVREIKGWCDDECPLNLEYTQFPALEVIDFEVRLELLKMDISLNGLMLGNSATLVEKLKRQVERWIKDHTPGNVNTAIELIELFNNSDRGFRFVWTDIYEIADDDWNLLVPQGVSQDDPTSAQNQLLT
jgi:hypothetical protein